MLSIHLNSYLFDLINVMLKLVFSLEVFLTKGSYGFEFTFDLFGDMKLLSYVCNAFFGNFLLKLKISFECVDEGVKDGLLLIKEIQIFHNKLFVLQSCLKSMTVLLHMGTEVERH